MRGSNEKKQHEASFEAETRIRGLSLLRGQCHETMVRQPTTFHHTISIGDATMPVCHRDEMRCSVGGSASTLRCGCLGS